MKMSQDRVTTESVIITDQIRGKCMKISSTADLSEQGEVTRIAIQSTDADVVVQSHHQETEDDTTPVAGGDEIEDLRAASLLDVQSAG